MLLVSALPLPPLADPSKCFLEVVPSKPMTMLPRGLDSLVLSLNTLPTVERTHDSSEDKIPLALPYSWQAAVPKLYPA